MSAKPMYLLMSSHQRHPSTNKPVEAYVIDRTPQGPLSEYVEDQDKGCSPCGMKNCEAGVPDRKVIRLPEAVKKSYHSSIYAQFVNRYTLPGFLSWCAQNGYDTLDMKHVMGIEYGIWIQYTDSSEDEFRSIATRALPTFQRTLVSSAPAPKKNNLRRAGNQHGPNTKEAKSVAQRVAKPVAKRVGIVVRGRRLLHK